MIVPMKRVAVIVQSKDADSAVEALGSLSVLHVEHEKPPEGKDITTLADDIALVEKARMVLASDEYAGRAASTSQAELKDWKFTARHIADSHQRMKRLKEYSRSVKKTIGEWEAWGDFDSSAIKGLDEKNIYVRLYRVPAKEIKKFPPSVIVKRLFTVRGVAHLAAISREKVDIPFKELALPKAGIARMRSRLAEDTKVMESVRADIQGFTRYAPALKRVKESLEKELEFQKALKGMGESGNIMYLTGFAPQDSEDKLMEAAKKEKWGIIISDPGPEDNVPTLIRNPRWVSIIAPVFKIIEVVPGYKEMDISFWFLAFFSVFFGMLIGDAGYGLIFFILTLLAQLKWAKRLQEKSVFILFYLLSSCAILWGVLTATFFGQEWLPASVKPLVPALRDARSLQILCFLLGATQLSVAHIWRGIIKLPSPKALSEIGWVSILWGAFFLAKTLILGDPFPGYVKWFFVAGPTLVVLFTHPQRNPLKGIAAGIGNLLLNLVNNFTDIVSYVRLFAVGLATVAVADAFNKMAMQVGYNGFITGIITTFIILLGHTLNIVLGPLAILVHGVRLNVLEFCNHLDIKWSGFSYKPLRKEKGAPGARNT